MTTIDSAAIEPPAPSASLVVIRQCPMDLPVLSEAVPHRAEPSSTEKHETDGETSSTKRSYPEGGREAWLVVFGSFCAMVSAFGIMNTLGTFQTHLESNQLRDYSEGQIGWIFGVYAFTSFFGGILVGRYICGMGRRVN